MLRFVLSLFLGYNIVLTTRYFQSVVAVVNMAEPLSCIFYISAFLLYRGDISARTAQTTNNVLLDLVSFLRKLLWICCVLTAAVIKETGITAGALVIGDCLISLLQSLNTVGKFSDGLKMWIWLRTGWMFIVTLSFLFYVVLRVVIVKTDIQEFFATCLMFVTGESREALQHLLALWEIGGNSADSLYLGSSELIRKAENPFAFLNNPIERILSLMYLHYRYILLLIWPFHLCAEYAFDCIPKISDISDYRNFYTIIIYSGIIFIGFVGLYNLILPSSAYMHATKKEESSNSQFSVLSSSRPESVLVALCWFVVSFAPISGVILLVKITQSIKSIMH